jgi:secreted trypsin-like serine protease
MKAFIRWVLAGSLTMLVTHTTAQPQGVAGVSKSLMQQAVDRFNAKDKGARIVGGTAANWDQNRWQVALVYAKDSDNARAQFCGASIISPGWVITAAHCVDKKYPASDYAVLSGTDNLKSGGSRSRILSYTIHEAWRVAGNKSRYDNDIALLRIDSTTPMVGNAIALVPADAKLENLQVLVTGWGVTEYRPSGTELLQQVTVPSVDKTTCNAKKAYDGAVTDQMFCAGEYKKDSCQGDSGGPATAVVQGTRMLIGIVSWGIGCGERDKYGVYTNLPLYRAWISKNTGGEVK